MPPEGEGQFNPQEPLEPVEASLEMKSSEESEEILPAWRRWSFQEHKQQLRKLGLKSDPTYKEGLQISERLFYTHFDDRPQRSGEQKYVESEQMQKLLDCKKELSLEKRKEILNQATSIYHTRNLLFHTTPHDRVPLIAKIGVLSRKLAEKFTTQKYNGLALQSSNWGVPRRGLNYIDVSDPAAVILGKDTSISENNSVDDDYNSRKHVTFRGPTFVIQLKKDFSRLCYRGDEQSNWSFIRHRVKPNELIGLILPSLKLNEVPRIDIAKFGMLLEDNALLDPQRNEIEQLNEQQVLEIIGRNIELPIYDGEGNLLWPERISEEELLSSALEKQKLESDNQQDNAKASSIVTEEIPE